MSVARRPPRPAVVDATSSRPRAGQRPNRRNQRRRRRHVPRSQRTQPTAGRRLSVEGSRDGRRATSSTSGGLSGGRRDLLDQRWSSLRLVGSPWFRGSALARSHLNQRPHRPTRARPQLPQLAGVALPVLGDADLEVEVDPGAEQRLDLLAGAVPTSRSRPPLCPITMAFCDRARRTCARRCRAGCRRAGPRAAHLLDDDRDRVRHSSWTPSSAASRISSPTSTCSGASVSSPPAIQRRALRHPVDQQLGQHVELLPRDLPRPGRSRPTPRSRPARRCRAAAPDPSGSARSLLVTTATWSSSDLGQLLDEEPVARADLLVAGDADRRPRRPLSSVVCTRSFSRSPSSVRGLCSPGVSTRTSWPSARCTMPRTTLRVVCGLDGGDGDLLADDAFVSVDLPALGRPTKQAKPLRKPSVAVKVGGAGSRRESVVRDVVESSSLVGGIRGSLLHLLLAGRVVVGPRSRRRTCRPPCTPRSGPGSTRTGLPERRPHASSPSRRTPSTAVVALASGTCGSPASARTHPPSRSIPRPRASRSPRPRPRADWSRDPKRAR